MADFSLEGSGVRPRALPLTSAPNVNTTDSPTVQRIISAYDTPSVRPATNGLETLSNAFENFFGKTVTALGAVKDASTYTERAQIARENQRQELRGNTDALLGKSADASLSGDLDYTTAYAKTTGALGGQKLYEDWLQHVYASAKPGDDLSAATETFLRQEVGSGTGNTEHDAAMLVSFDDLMSRKASEFRADSTKALLADGLQKKDAEVAGLVRGGGMNVGEFGRLTDEYRAMDPMSPDKAPARTVGALLSAVGDDFASAQRVSAMLHQPGTGSGPGKSFYESFPDMGEAIDEKLAQKYESGRSLASIKAYDDLDAQVHDARTADSVVQSIITLESTRSRYGKGGQYDAIRDKLAAKLDKLAETTTAINRIDETIAGGRPIDVSEVRKYQMDYLAAKGVDPLKNPAAAAKAVLGMRVVGDDLKVNMSGALGDFSNPESQAQAFMFYRSLDSGANGPSFAVDGMTDDVKDLYLQTKARYDASPDNLVADLQFVDANRDTLAKAKGLTLSQVSGKTMDIALPAAEGTIRATLRSLNDAGHPLNPFSAPSVTLDPILRNSIVDTAIQNFAVRNKSGNAKWDTVLRDTVKAMGSKLELIPGMDGKYTATIRQLPDADPTTGKPILPFGTAVWNPMTRKVEDTVQTFRDDVANVSALMPELIHDTSHISIGVTPHFAGYGVYTVQHDAVPLTIPLGATVHIWGEKITLSKNPVEAAKVLDAKLFANKAPTQGMVEPPLPNPYAAGKRDVERFAGTGQIAEPAASELRQPYRVSTKGGPR